MFTSTHSEARQGSPAGSTTSVVAHRFSLALLRSPLRRLFGGLCELQFIGRISGRSITLPVQCAREDMRLVVYVGHAASKQWWRNFTDDRTVRVRLHGIIYSGSGRVIGGEHPDRVWAEACYGRRFPRVIVAAADPMVIINLTRVSGDLATNG